ncbi:MAG: hypothetical protein H6573_34680 [Lewinellaceae bacterium]|nr:hypothetical protein [Lewinellaceae bacterium]
MNTADFIQFLLLLATIIGLTYSIWMNTVQFIELNLCLREKVAGFSNRGSQPGDQVYTGTPNPSPLFENVYNQSWT